MLKSEISFLNGEIFILPTPICSFTGSRYFKFKPRLPYNYNQDYLVCQRQVIDGNLVYNDELHIDLDKYRRMMICFPWIRMFFNYCFDDPIEYGVRCLKMLYTTMFDASMARTGVQSVLFWNIIIAGSNSFDKTLMYNADKLGRHVSGIHYDHSDCPDYDRSCTIDHVDKTFETSFLMIYLRKRSDFPNKYINLFDTLIYRCLAYASDHFDDAFSSLWHFEPVLPQNKSKKHLHHLNIGRILPLRFEKIVNLPSEISYMIMNNTTGLLIYKSERLNRISDKFDGCCQNFWYLDFVMMKAKALIIDSMLRSIDAKYLNDAIAIKSKIFKLYNRSRNIVDMIQITL